MLGREFALDVLARMGGDDVLELLDEAITARFVADTCGCNVSAVDLTEEYCETARWLNRLVGLDERISVRQADVTELPFGDATFDVVFSQLVVQFRPDRPTALREMHRVLVPGGRLAFSVYSPIERTPGALAFVRALDEALGPESSRIKRGE